jgi:hypothetical protein
VADVEDPFHFMDGGFFVVVIRVFPVDRVTRRRLQVSFCGHDLAYAVKGLPLLKRQPGSEKLIDQFGQSFGVTVGV